MGRQPSSTVRAKEDVKHCDCVTRGARHLSGPEPSACRAWQESRPRRFRRCTACSPRSWRRLARPRLCPPLLRQRGRAPRLPTRTRKEAGKRLQQVRWAQHTSRARDRCSSAPCGRPRPLMPLAPQTAMNAATRPPCAPFRPHARGRRPHTTGACSTEATARRTCTVRSAMAVRRGHPLVKRARARTGR